MGTDLSRESPLLNGFSFTDAPLNFSFSELSEEWISHKCNDVNVMFTLLRCKSVEVSIPACRQYVD